MTAKPLPTPPGAGDLDVALQAEWDKPAKAPRAAAPPPPARVQTYADALREIPLGELHESVHNVRKTFAAGPLKELAASKGRRARRR